MTRTFLISILFLCVHSLLAQSERLVLIEQGTNANSNASANQNPDFEALLDANSDKVVYLRYHWFFPGADPLNEDNPEEADDRFNDYYGLSIVPQIVVDGVLPDEETVGFDENGIGWTPGSPGGISQTLIDTAQAVPSPFDISIAYEAGPENIDVNVNATCTQDTSGNFKLRIVVIEEEIVFEESPGSNGETLFKNVMKKFLPGVEGLDMADAYAIGESFSANESWQLNNVYDPSQLAVIAFIQNDDTKEILQAAFFNDGSFAPEVDLDAAILDVSGLETDNCLEEISPTITIRNNGLETLTSLDIEYEINDIEGSVNWTGSLGFFETSEFNLGSISFNQNDNNTISINLANPNGGVDENPDNDTLIESIAVSPLATLDLTLIVRTDFYPAETSWELRNSSNDLLEADSYSGPPGGGGIEATAEFQYSINLEEYDCYSFTLFDDEGDGMGFTGGNPNAVPFGFQILNDDASVVTEFLGDELDFGFDYTVLFETQEGFGVEENRLSKSFKIYPNPSRGNVTLSFNLEESEPIWVEVYTVEGRLIEIRNLGTISQGQFTRELDLSGLEGGFYLVGIRTSQTRATRKVSILN